MNKKLSRFVELYSKFIVSNYIIIILIMILLFAVGVQFSKRIETENLEYKSILPQDIEVVQAFNEIDDKFGGGNFMNIVVELDEDSFSYFNGMNFSNYSHVYSNGLPPNDVRNYEVFNFVDILVQYLNREVFVESISSPSELIKRLNNGYIPQDSLEIKKYVISNPLFKSFISEDGKMLLLKVQLSDGYDTLNVIRNMREILNGLNVPYGYKVSIGGNAVTQPIVRELLKDDTKMTSNFSMIGIIVILLLLFRSFKYGMIPLSTILFGIVFALGFIGFIGLGMTSATSGVISMIMGIGIDFGIQTISRFREELNNLLNEFKDLNFIDKSDFYNLIDSAMVQTMKNVIPPMFITTLSALIGFKAMAMGKLSLLKEMGTMMSIGIVMCFIAAVSIVPSVIVLAERFSFILKRFFINKEVN